MQENKMSYQNINSLIWKMGIPMVFSMVLQAIYNVVDTIYVINSSSGTIGNEALTAAFPIQILIIAIGVGTGVGINSLLSLYLGKKEQEKLKKVAGNGLFLALIICLIFLLFGLFGVEPYMHLMAKDEQVIKYGVNYLRICCCFSLGSIGFTVYERFLQSTGKTLHSMIAQITGAIANIILDYVFIFPLNMGVVGAALATVIGQFISLFIAMTLHYFLNKEIKHSISDIKPSLKIIKNIYKIGFPAAIMQGLLAIMMFIVILIINTIQDEVTRILMINSFGIYYKIMQIALFALFGFSNTLITIVAFNNGLNNQKRVNLTIKWGIINSFITALVISLLFELFASQISSLFAMSIDKNSLIAKQDIINTCSKAMRIASTGYIFMSISIAIQGILQGLRNVFKPVLISFLRLIVFLVPFCFIFVNSNDVSTLFWLSFPITEILTSIVSIFLLKDSINKYIVLNIK